MSTRVSRSPVDVLDELDWRHDRVLLGDLVLRLEHYKDEHWELGEECLAFFKDRRLVDEYRAFLARRPEFHPANVLELGIWDGGSTAFWSEVFQPRRHVAIDIIVREDSAYFRHYVESRGLLDRIHTVWGVGQSDRSLLERLVAHEFQGPLDLVIDDASHYYGPTRTSFETLFPCLREGGLFFLEDWAWGHWPEFHPPDPMARNEPLTRLIADIVQVAGTSSSVVRSVHVCRGFVAVERGEAALQGATFDLQTHTCPLPKRYEVLKLRALDRVREARHDLGSIRRRVRVAGRRARRRL